MLTFAIIAVVVYLIWPQKDFKFDPKLFFLICTVLWFCMKFAFKTSLFLLVVYIYWPQIKSWYEKNSVKVDHS